MNGKIVELKKIIDEALKRSATVEHVIVVKRTGQDSQHGIRPRLLVPRLDGPADRRNAGQSRCETEVMDAEDPLFMLYTSGTTGKPKAILHTHGGYMVGVATTLENGLRPERRGPLLVHGRSGLDHRAQSTSSMGRCCCGATSFMYEGAPTFPYPNRWWSMIEKYGINVLYTAPTAIRGLMRFGEAWPNRHDLSSLRLLGSVGEPINPEAWRWYYEVIGKNRCPIMDTWWQTETGCL